MTLAFSIEDFSLHSLDLLQRILVTTDGTVTETLAAVFLEPIELVKLAVTIVPNPEAFPALELEGGSNLMQRQIVLRGSRSGTPYVYAEVVIAADRLPQRLREDLLEGRIPLGQLWIAHRLETFKERPRIRQRVAGTLARPSVLSRRILSSSERTEPSPADTRCSWSLSSFRAPTGSRYLKVEHGRDVAA